MRNESTPTIDPRPDERESEPGNASSPLVSIVLPTHNRPALLQEAVDSVLHQTEPRWELIIIDDASDPPVRPDQFPDYHGRIHVHRNDHAEGGAASKAFGTKLARAELIAYLDDDDLYDPEYVNAANSVFKHLPELGVLFVGVEWFGQNAEQEGAPHRQSLDWILHQTNTRPSETQVHAFGETLFGALLEKMPMPFQRPVVRRSSSNAIGLHRPDCLLWDCDWALRAALRARCALLTRPLYRQRASEQGYHSRPGTHLAQARSELEIVRRLRRNYATDLNTPHKKRLVRRNIGKRSRQLAYQYAQQGDVLQTLRYSFLGQIFTPNVRDVRTLAAAVYYAFLRLQSGTPSTQ